MERDAKKMRGEGPIVFAQVTKGVGTNEIAEAVLRAWKGAVGASA
jgi:urease accessory protein